MTGVVDLVAGARPNFVKLAPVQRALAAAGAIQPRIVHTGQHHDPGMADVFFRELGIPASFGAGFRFPELLAYIGRASFVVLQEYSLNPMRGTPNG